MDTLNDRLNNIEIALTNLQRTTEELNTECVRQAKLLEKLERENKSLKESLENNVKPLSEETPPPHY